MNSHRSMCYLSTLLAAERMKSKTKGSSGDNLWLVMLLEEYSQKVASTGHLPMIRSKPSVSHISSIDTADAPARRWLTPWGLNLRKDTSPVPERASR